MHVLEEGASGVQVGDIEQVKCNFSFFKKKKVYIKIDDFSIFTMPSNLY